MDCSSAGWVGISEPKLSSKGSIFGFVTILMNGPAGLQFSATVTRRDNSPFFGLSRIETKPRQRKPATLPGVAALRAWATLGLSATLWACSGDDHPPPLGAGRALPECPQLNYDTCDTRAAACQKRLLALAGCVYGVATTPDVPVRVLTEEQLLEELSAEPDAEPSEDETADLPHIERTLVELELMQAGELTEDGGSLAQIVANIAGVYQNAERGIVLVDRGVPQNDAEADALLLHEFVHAIQDAELGLDAWREQYSSNVDTALALRTVTEGQATYAQFRAVLAMTGRDVDRIDWDRTLSGFRDQLVGEAFADPSPFFASITTFPYAYGAASARQAWSDHQAQFDAPPLTTLEVLSRDAGVAFTAPDALSLEMPTPDADYRFVDGDALGAFQLALSAHQLGADTDTALDLALAWRGDALLIYAGPNDETVWLWALELGDASHADDLVALAGPRSWDTASNGKRVAFVGGSARANFLSDAAAAFLSAAP